MKRSHLRQTRLYIATLIFCSYFSSSAQLEAVENFYSRQEGQAKNNPVTIEFVQEESGLVENYSSLRQIVLLRHGEPALDKKGWRKRKEAMNFIIAYDSVEVYQPAYVPVKLIEKDVEVIYTSTLNRSISTAAQVFQRPEDQQAKGLFREFERKIFLFPNIKLPLKWWLTGSRLFWFMGLNKKDIESFSMAKKRAKQAVLFLENDASRNGKTLLVSHGLLNHYLAKYLQKNGWTEVYDGGKGYLSQKMFMKHDLSFNDPLN